MSLNGVVHVFHETRPLAAPLRHRPSYPRPSSATAWRLLCGSLEDVKWPARHVISIAGRFATTGPYATAAVERSDPAPASATAAGECSKSGSA